MSVADAPSHPGFILRGASPPDFRGLYCTPIKCKAEGHSDQPIGMLVVDRKKAEKVDENGVNVLEGLAVMIALLLDPN